MATYIVLASYTDQGIRNIKEAPARLRQAEQLAQQLGCKITSFHLTLGAYDFVATVEAPDDESVARLLLSLGSQGNVRTTTLKALSRDQFEQIIRTMP